MSYLDAPYEPHEEDDDDPCSSMPALSPGQAFYSAEPFASTPMPAANHNPRIDDHLENIIEEPDTSGCYHGSWSRLSVTGTQQQYGGQLPQRPSMVPPSDFSDLRHPHGTASAGHPRPPQHHVDGIQQDLSDAQGGCWGAVDPLPPRNRAHHVLYAQGDMLESRETRDGSRMLHANMPNPEYWNRNNATRHDSYIAHNALGDANDGIGDVHSYKGDFNSQPEPSGTPVMPFDGNAAMNAGSFLPMNVGNPLPMNMGNPPPMNIGNPLPMNMGDPPPMNMGNPPPMIMGKPSPMNMEQPPPMNMSHPLAMNMDNTATPGNVWGPITGEPSEETNATLQTPRMNPEYESLKVPTYDTHMFGQPPEALAPTDPAHRPLQPLHPNPLEGSLNETREPGSTSAVTQGQPRGDTASRGSRPRKARKLNTLSPYEKARKAYVKKYDLACDSCKKRKTRVRP